MSIQTTIAKTPKRARGVQRVAQLLDAGAALFAAKGYEATTMTEIARCADASIGSLYQFFPSKEALAEALFARYSGRIAFLLEDLVQRAPELSPARLADRLIDLMLDVRSDRDAAAALSSSVAAVVERRKAPRGVLRRQITATLRAANPRLTSNTAASAATLIAHVLKIVPALAKEEEEGGQGLIAQSRKLLSTYIKTLTDQ